MFEKYGFQETIPENEWCKDDLIIYAGLGQDENNNFTIELYTLCKRDDVGDSEKIIFRGELNEIETHFRKHNRPKTIDELLR